MLRSNTKALPIARDKGLVQKGCCSLSIIDTLQSHFSNKPILEAAIDPFTSASGLGRVREDQTDRQLLHGPFKLGFL